MRARRRAAPAQNAAEIPKKSAITTPSTDAHTDAAPLTPQRNAVGASGVPAATRMPMANGMPMHERERREQRDGGGDAHGSGCAVGCLEHARRDESEDRDDAEQHDERGQQRRRPFGSSRSVRCSMLPMPLNTSIENSTTVRP